MDDGSVDMLSYLALVFPWPDSGGLSWSLIKTTSQRTRRGLDMRGLGSFTYGSRLMTGWVD